MLVALRRRAPEHHLVSRRDPMDARHPCRATAEPHPRQVVAGKDRVPFEGAGCDDHLLRHHQVQKVRCDDRYQRSFIHPHRGAALDDRDRRSLSENRAQLVDAGPGRPRRDLLADRSFIREQHGLAPVRCGHGRAETGNAAADHAAVRMVTQPLARRGLLIAPHRTQAAQAPDDTLHHRPEAAGPEHRLVVEAHRHQATGVPEEGPHIVVGRRPAGGTDDLLPGSRAELTHARTPGSPSTVSWQLGQSPERQ